jgi:hypothetical protein
VQRPLAERYRLARSFLRACATALAVGCFVLSIYLVIKCRADAMNGWAPIVERLLTFGVSGLQVIYREFSGRAHASRQCPAFELVPERVCPQQKQVDQIPSRVGRSSGLLPVFHFANHDGRTTLERSSTTPTRAAAG